MNEIWNQKFVKIITMLDYNTYAIEWFLWRKWINWIVATKKKYYAKEEIEQLTEMFKKQDDFNEVVK